MKNLFRSPEGQRRYQRYQKAGGLKECALCSIASVKEFKYWRIAVNKFPYDRIARVHHMILPKRHVTEHGLKAPELGELRRIKENYIDKKYDFIIEATRRTKSIPAHFHLHLILVKLIK